ncbi:MAG: ATP synthase F1 subunit delta [bacterium]|nr:ATP synthase F1 subunit delta [Acidimicrobiia bacterium]MCY4649667.1 ATP synthase F1 subunit delta [bacterium]
MSEVTEGYADALFGLAAAESQLEQVESELYVLARAVESSPELTDALSDPHLPSDRRQSLMSELLSVRAAPVTREAVSLLIRMNRLSDVVAIADRLAEKAALSRGRKIAEVRSAVALSPETIARLEEVLTKAVGHPVEVRAVVDPDVLGGVVARVGDLVVDGTVRSRMNQVRALLADV